MTSYKLILKTKSYTCFSDIENNVFIDSDISFDKFGLPIVKARRIKGLLRESAQEILDFSEEKNGENLLNDLFGERGKSEGFLKWNSFYIEDYTSIANQLEAFNSHKKNIKETGIPTSFCKNYFTSLIPTTAIEHNSKSAKQNSLRTIRAVNKDITFIALLQYSGTDKDKAFQLLELAVKNLQEAGLNRNRGLGDIELSILQQSLDEVNSKPEIRIPDLNDDENTIVVQYQLVQPVIIPTLGADANTVSTADIIPGNVLRGVVAKMLEAKDINDILNENKVTFSYGFPMNEINDGDSTKWVKHYPLPLFIHEIKDQKDNYVNLFTYKDAEITKPKRGMGRLELSGSDLDFYTHKVQKVYGFHSSRNAPKERLTGKSESESSAIFYYEAIAAGQVYEFTICGEHSLVNNIKNLLKAKPEVNLGKSKTVEYGKARLLDITPSKTVNSYIEKDEEYILSFISPAILFNQYGSAAPNVETLTGYLQQYGVTVNNAALSVTDIEIGNSLWKTMPLRYKAINAGSSFLIKSDKEKIDLENAIGEFTDMGFGSFQLVDVKDFKIKKEDSVVAAGNGTESNAIIDAFKEEQEKLTNEKNGFIVGRNKRLKSTLVSTLYDLVKKSTDNDTFYYKFSKEALSPIAYKILTDKHIFEHINDFKDKDWNKETKPYLSGYLKAMRINAKKSNNHE